MRSLPILLVALATTGCGTVYSVPAALNAPAPPVIPLYRGVGDLVVTADLNTTSLGGGVMVSPAPHLGLHARGAVQRPRLGTEEASLRRIEQSEVEAGATVYGPTSGTLRAELTVSVGTGRVVGYGADSVGTTGFCWYCGSEPVSDLYRAEATRGRQSAHVTLAADGGVAAVGLVAGLSRVHVSDVRRDDRRDLPNATGTFADTAFFLRSRLGAASASLMVGGSVPIGEHATPDENGVVRALGGAYRSSPRPYVGLDVRVDLGGLLRPAEG